MIDENDTKKNINKNITDINDTEKIRLLKLELDQTNNQQFINKLFDIYVKLNKNNSINNTLIDQSTDNIQLIDSKKNSRKIRNNKKLTKIIDKNCPKYIVLLKLINSILTNLEMNNIKELTEFQNVDRNNIIKEENINTFKNMEEEIFKYFDKSESGWYRRNKVSYYILTFLRYACENIGLTFSYIYKNKIKNTIIKTHILYSIN